MFIWAVAHGQSDLDYYLPDITYEEDVIRPGEILGFQVGEYHVTHDQLLYYLTRICEQSPSCHMFEYARSHEQRPLVYLAISSPENIASLDSLKHVHRLLTDNERSSRLDLSKLPLVLYQGYSIHGDESSGGNAAMLVAYYLLAGRSPALEDLLDHTIILLDPCYNPDGFQRYSSWVNMHKSHVPVTDPQSRQFNEVWPDARTNHYWFDLNRDWLFTIHPESKGRIEVFHEWKPDILTDHHEMGSNRTFFFQPGIPSRTNPNTPQVNQDLTEAISRYHATYLDSIGSLYFTKESYDDFYYGKGSTYPDINGCIGILFEQATSEGNLRETDNGLLSFPFTIRNQVVTSLSTQEAARQMRTDILAYKRDFFANKTRPRFDGYYIFEAPDPYVRRYFINMLQRHDIKVYKHNPAALEAFEDYNHRHSFLVPMDQMQSVLVKTIFENVLKFNDPNFYDVSAWTMPHALNIRYHESSLAPDWNMFAEASPDDWPEYNFNTDGNTVAIALDWSAYLSPRVLYSLLEQNIDVRILNDTSSFRSGTQLVEMSPGTMIVHLSEQSENRDTVIALVRREVKENGVFAIAIDGAYPEKGQALGSPGMGQPKAIQAAMIVGDGVNRYVAGDAWFLLDQRFEIPLTLLDVHDFNRADLSRYDVIIMPDGRYDDATLLDYKLKDWVRSGGTLVAMEDALVFLNNEGMITLNRTVTETPDDTLPDPALVESQRISGAIVRADVTGPHPMVYGYTGESLPLFRKGTRFYQPTENSAATVLQYHQEPLLSGYISGHNKKQLSGSAALSVFGLGKGRIIAFADNPNFRGYWLGGSKLFANALFFAPMIQDGGLQR